MAFEVAGGSGVGTANAVCGQFGFLGYDALSRRIVVQPFKMFVCVGLCVTLPSHARPKLPAPMPTLEEVLTGAGWTMTPERTSTYAVGDVYSRSQNAPVMFKADCFSAEPREGLYTSLEVVQAMKAGARVPLGIARVKAGGMEYKQRRFAEPYVSEIASLQLNPSESCRKALARVGDPSDLFVITSVLSAEVKEQLCRSIEGGAAVAGFSVGAEVQQQCAQESEGHVVVAYKTRPWLDVLARAPLPVRQVAAGISVQTATAAADFGETAGLDVAGKLKLQRCKTDAKDQGERIRAAKMEEARNATLRAATTAWEGMQPELEQCIGLSAELKVDCVRALESWLGQARSLQVTIEKGEELVPTECGEIAAAFEREQQTFEAAEVVDAEGLLRRLQMSGSAGNGGGLFELTFSAPTSQYDTLHVLCHTGGFAKGAAEGVVIAGAGAGPCRVEAFGGTGSSSATVVVSEGGHYRCEGRTGALKCTRSVR